jgi:hypothetical protein
MMTEDARNATKAAQRLGLSENVITIEPPEGCAVYSEKDKGEPITGGQVRFRGRAAAMLSEGVARRPWAEFSECPDEDFVDLGRVHVDVYGNVHLCQGLVMGNLWQQPLKEIVASYNPSNHPIIGPLMEDGPVGLVERYGLPYQETYVDACHLCYLARDSLRSRFPEYLTPAIVYGEL